MTDLENMRPSFIDLVLDDYQRAIEDRARAQTAEELVNAGVQQLKLSHAQDELDALRLRIADLKALLHHCLNGGRMVVDSSGFFVGPHLCETDESDLPILTEAARASLAKHR